MYFLGLIIFLAFLTCTVLFLGSPAALIDLPSISLILSFSITMLLASGLFPDFIRCFKIMGKGVNTWSALELRKTEIALSLMIKLLLLSGLLGSITGTISILASLSDISVVGPNLAVAILTFFYSVLLVFILLPVKAKVTAMLQTMD